MRRVSEVGKEFAGELFVTVIRNEEQARLKLQALMIGERLPECRSQGCSHRRAFTIVTLLYSNGYPAMAKSELESFLRVHGGKADEIRRWYEAWTNAIYGISRCTEMQSRLS